ncbi:TetR family transcriptional regulator [Mycobacteroides abscessus subsp. abscessus]|uniref:TetR/AcrR family transcriptional regulator n=1 Tax=Mycobacteroides abscessus TaxID=36809 RepID=UPI00092C44F5|nr:helix-turn-helix domain-containing protein [Mycobacteroides abscessus]SIE23586.1 TetR family transcriptional regulator [Mycobacteroides abscessus subsp. abscessus]SIG06868.1 TetR family transcriptional regulator [Mycobacteroides abscessus subsp. abscessus]SIG25276.1 TetR family transcriptional regulator [Mycobacteroides abscessus subsp. abscessus]SIG61912.1 TetR family transcriptional regulator [Mycobacteroides abscessus subsp. abscessus]SII44628.1 TetR family transcriptional regulator [Myc
MNKVVVAGRTRVGGERRERILASATELIAERGYHAVSMADIGVASGVVGPAIYRHFDSKSDLLAALFERVVDKLLKRLFTDEGVEVVGASLPG